MGMGVNPSTDVLLLLCAKRGYRPRGYKNLPSCGPCEGGTLLGDTLNAAEGVSGGVVGNLLRRGIMAP